MCVISSDLAPCYVIVRCQNKPHQNHWLQVVQRFITHYGISEGNPWGKGPVKKLHSDVWVERETDCERELVGEGNKMCRGRKRACDLFDVA